MQMKDNTVMDAGCLVHDRQTPEDAMREVIRLAQAHGMPESEGPDDVAVMSGTDLIDVLQYLMEWAEDAEDWLNEHVAPTGWIFTWDDGEFFLTEMV